MAPGQIQDGRRIHTHRRVKPFTAIARAGLISASLLAAVPQTVLFATPAAAQDQRPPSFADLADKVRPAVVSVNVKTNGGLGDVSARDFPLPDLPPDHPLREFFDQFKKQPERHATRAQGSSRR